MNARGKAAALALTTAILGSVGALGSSARASSSGVPVSLLTSGACTSCRTLVLQDTAGNSLSGLDLTPGTAGFVAKVVDGNYLDNGFTVVANMSNLYSYNSGTGKFDCTVTPVPSSDVSLVSNQGLLDASGLGSVVQPVFSLSGNLTSILGGLGLGGGTLSGLNVNGITQTLNQADLVGSGPLQNVTNLVGSSLTSLTGLPLSLTGGGATPTSFANPAAPPAGSGCTDTTGAGATNAPVMTGGLPATPATPLLGDLSSLIGTTPTLGSLVSGGFVNATSAINAIAQQLSIPLNLLSTSIITNIESTVTATLTGLVPAVTNLTGNYASSPSMSVNTSNVPAGSYRGELTITLADTPSA